jgi:zinc transport system substrate-binding protein
MKRKIVSMTIIFLFIFSTVLSGCSSTQPLNLVQGKINIVTSFYPLYDFASKIGGKHVHVMNLVPAGVEPHDWSPTSGVMRTISNADLLIYNGIGLEGWIEDFLQSLKADSSLIAIEASKDVDLLPAQEDSNDEHSHQDSSSHENEEHDGNSYDPHIWLSLQNAKQIAANVRDGLIQIDSMNQATYEANYIQLVEQFEMLDKSFRTSLASLPKKEIAVSHQAFAYLCRDYGLTQIAVMGLSPDAEPTAQKIKQISDFIKEHQLKYIFFEELVSDKLAKTLAQDLQIETLVLNPLEGLTKDQVAAGADYISIMKKNFEHLIKALQ